MISCRGRAASSKKGSGGGGGGGGEGKKRGKEGERRAVPTGAQIEIAFKVSAQVGALAHFIMIRSDQAWRETARRRPYSVAWPHFQYTEKQRSVDRGRFASSGEL